MCVTLNEVLTEEEFEKLYAERSGTTVEWLHANGRFAIPCDCEDYCWCTGWQMSYSEEER